MFGRITKNLTFIAVILSSGLALAEAVPGVTDTSIKLGSHGPLSGPYSIYGLLYKGAQAYFAKLNDDGGIYGRKVEYIVQDDQSSPNKAMEQVKKLVQKDNVFAFLTPTTFTHDAVFKFVMSHKIPDFLIADGTAAIADKQSNYAFFIIPSWAREGELMANFIAKHFPGKKVAFVGQDEPAGHEGIKAAKKVLENKVTFGPEMFFLATDQSFDPQVLKMKNEKVDVIFSMQGLGQNAAMLREAAQIGYKPKWVLASYNGSGFMVELAGEAAEGVYAGVYIQEGPANEIAKVNAILKKYQPDLEFNWMVAAGWTSAEVMTEILKKAGKNLTRDAAVAAAESLSSIKTTFGVTPFGFSKTNHNIMQGYDMYQLKSGKWTKAD